METAPSDSQGDLTSKKELQAPNYTQIPNALFGMMLSMTGAELKCVLAIARETFGWHRSSQEISLSRLMELTGLSRQGVINGIEVGMERGIIDRANEGQGFSYSLSVEAELVKKVDQLNVPTSQESGLVKKVDQSKKLTSASPKSRPEVVNKLDQPIKEDKEIKETLKERDTPATPADELKGKKSNSAVEPFFGDFCEAYSTHHSGIPYRESTGDFVQFAGLKSKWTAVKIPLPEAWAVALRNYFATPQRTYSMADLCRHFGEFYKSARDQYGKPVGGNSNGRIVGEAKPVPGKYSGVGRNSGGNP